MDIEIVDPKQIAVHKQKYRGQLAPIIEVIEHRKSELSSRDWVDFVKRVEDSLLKTPEQYLFGALPSRAVLSIIINEIFQEEFHCS